ncbi:MAG: hypothetical protein HC893_02275, partial [Chloroflexaceae bacterium]|nr:hypothetical protein [Chloroflexaceae bacterium]
MLPHAPLRPCWQVCACGVGTGTGAAALCGVAGSLVQHRARAQQQVQIGTVFDQGYVHYFSEREQSSSQPPVSFRWAQTWSQLRLWPLPSGQAAVLSLRMQAPPQPDGLQQTRLSLDGQPLATLAVDPEFATYRVLLPAATGRDLIITMESAPLVIEGETRELGVAV